MRNLLGLGFAAALTFWAALEFNAYQCAARWQGLTASYTLLSGCMVEVDLLKVPEGNIRVPQDSVYLRVNPHVIE
jgi:hypothetical protein